MYAFYVIGVLATIAQNHIGLVVFLAAYLALLLLVDEGGQEKIPVCFSVDSNTLG
jgi:hypothetical protein